MVSRGREQPWKRRLARGLLVAYQLLGCQARLAMTKSNKPWTRFAAFVVTAVGTVTLGAEPWAAAQNGGPTLTAGVAVETAGPEGAVAAIGLSANAGATPPTPATVSVPTPPQQPQAPGQGFAPPASYASDEAPVPPGVEGVAYPSTYGGYCYVGPHPADTRVTPGNPWDGTQGQHFRPYAPIDLRLYSFRDGCYYFIGDPHDFGYAGQTYSYYGAHPVLAAYGGGWCFMMGGHAHAWTPWSPYFTVVGPWYYWHGPYDPFFWTYWPYYSSYYRTYYPHYYGGGRFYQGGFRVAPPLGRGFGRGIRTAPSVRGTAAPGTPQMYRAPIRGGAPGTPQSNFAPQRGFPATAAPRPSFSPGSPGPRMTGPGHFSAPSGGGFGSQGGGFRGGGRR